MKQNDDKMVISKAYEVFNVMEKRVSETDMIRIREAFEFAREAHAGQKRKSGEPYIIHPIAVAVLLPKSWSWEPILLLQRSCMTLWRIRPLPSTIY